MSSAASMRGRKRSRPSPAAAPSGLFRRRRPGRQGPPEQPALDRARRRAAASTSATSATIAFARSISRSERSRRSAGRGSEHDSGRSAARPARRSMVRGRSTFDGRDSLYLALREGNAGYRIDLRAAANSSPGRHRAKRLFRRRRRSPAWRRLNGPKGNRRRPARRTLSGRHREPRDPRDPRRADRNGGRRRPARATVPTAIRDGAGCARPHGIFVDRQGNVYIGDSSNHRVRMLRIST